MFAQIRAAWLEHLVLRFRGQKLTDPQVLAFSRNFGELDPPGPNPLGRPFLADHPEMNVISNIKEGGVPIGGLGDGEAIWHADMTYVERPPMAAILLRDRDSAGRRRYLLGEHVCGLRKPARRR